MKKICEFCKKEYDWVEGQPKWVKPNSDMKPTDKNAIRSDKFCCYQCGVDAHKQKREATMMKKYGVKIAAKNKEIYKKMKQTIMEKYGVEYISQNKEIYEKIKQTKKDKYGNENYNNNEKIKQTCFEKYGVENIFKSECFKTEMKQENLKKYGVEYISQVDKIKEKVRQTNLKNFGVEYSIQFNKIRQKGQITRLKKYGDKNYNNREKAKQTTLKRYGVASYTQTKEYIKKSKQTKKEHYGDENFTNREKAKRTTIEHLGVEYASQSPQILQKIYNTKKKNHTFNTSKPEKEMGLLLLEKFPDVKSQYKSQVYPFVCDFYIPSLELYIEFQGFWVHGKEPYNENKEEHIILLEEWENRSKSNPQYKRAIDTWTERDPMKRQTAKDNNLNWIEFFTFEDFLEWYEKQ